jgi:hypothetical protein
VTITFTLKSTSKVEVLDFDGKGTHTTVIDQTATLTCPVETYGVEETSYLDGATREQSMAAHRRGEAARKEVEAIKPQTVATMEALQKEFDACRKAGTSQEACGAAMMAKMSADPELMEAMESIGMADPAGSSDAELAVSGSAGRFQVWFSERCDGTMTANNSQTVVSAGGVTTMSERITGTRPVLGESNITVETNLDTSSSRYMFVPADASGFSSEGTGGKKSAQLAAAPEPVVLGPFPGPIKGGRYDTTVPGGTLRIDWTFQRSK